MQSPIIVTVKSRRFGLTETLRRSIAAFPAAHRAGASTGTRKVLPSLGVSSLDCRGANAPAFLGRSS